MAKALDVARPVAVDAARDARVQDVQRAALARDSLVALLSALEDLVVGGVPRHVVDDPHASLELH